MLGAMIGDIAGSRFEWQNCRSKQFELFHPTCFFTDDSVMSAAIAQAILDSRIERQHLCANAVRCMRAIGQRYPDCGYGARFRQWMYTACPEPYFSFGNGAAMRVSACGFAAQSLEDTLSMARAVTCVTHNHPEGIKGAEATAAAIYLARTGHSREKIRAYIERHYYPINFTLDQIRPYYRFNETCQATVPQAMAAFFESVSFEDAIRNAISLGGDSDTLAAITGGIAQAFYGIPPHLRRRAESYLDDRLLGILREFEAVYMTE